MKTPPFLRVCSTLMSLALMTTMLAASAAAQAPDAPGGPPPGQDGGPPPGDPNGGPPPGGPDGGGPGGAGQGADDHAAFRSPSPFAAGTVSAVDTGAGTITITSQSGGSSHSQVIKVNSDTQLVTQSEVALANLKVGDQVQVQGVPTGITVSSFTVGKAPLGLPGVGGVGPGGPGGTAAASSFATARGTVKTLPTKADPHLMISLGGALGALFVGLVAPSVFPTTYL